MAVISTFEEKKNNDLFIYLFFYLILSGQSEPMIKSSYHNLQSYFLSKKPKK